jgi:hypothetical protein
MAACADVLISLGAKPWDTAPWTCRMLWRMGVEARPPLYAGHPQRLVVQAIPFAAIMTAGMYLMNPSHLTSTAVIGTFLVMTFITISIDTWMAKRTRRSMNLPDWRQVQTLAAERIRS